MSAPTVQRQVRVQARGGIKKRRRQRQGAVHILSSTRNPPAVVKRLQGVTVANSSKARILLCSDGVTRVPYEVLGSDDSSSARRASFVVCQDVFDCLDATKLLFMDVLKKKPGCQILVFNQPGQAGTTFPRRRRSSADKDDAGEQMQAVASAHSINNDFHARILHELLCHVCSTGEFGTNSQRFHLLGLGNGLSIALSFAETYASSNVCGKHALISIVSINGYASVDPQLAGILHSAKNAFLSFPSNRPDLPVSYMSNYLFSDEYIERVSRNLALNIHTAVMNPISLEGRVCLVSGALKNRSMIDTARSLDVPIIAIQSTEDRLVHPSNVETLLQGRTVSYVWSHEVQPDRNDCYSQTQLPDMLNGCFGSSKSSVAIFVRAGHAVAQEWKASISGLLAYLALPDGPSSQARRPRAIGQPTVEAVAAIDKTGKGDGGSDESSEEGEIDNVDASREDRMEDDGVIAPPSFSAVSIEMSNGEDASHVGPLEVENDTTNQSFEPADACGATEVASTDTDPVPSCCENKDSKNEGSNADSNEDSIAGSNADSNANPNSSPINVSSCNESQEQTSIGKDKKLPQHQNTGADIADAEGFGPDSQQSPSQYTIRGAPDTVVGYSSPSGPQREEDALSILQASNQILRTLPKTPDYLASVTQRTKHIPSLEDYVTSGVPLDFVPSEIIAGQPSADQKKSRRWCEATASAAATSQVQHTVVPPPTVEELQMEFYQELEFERKRERWQIEKKKRSLRDATSGLSQIQREQDRRRLEYQQEDELETEKLEQENFAREKERARKQMQRMVEIDDIESVLIQGGTVKPFVPRKGDTDPVRSLPPTHYTAPGTLPSHLANVQLHDVLDGLESDAYMAKKMGILRMEEFDRVRSKMAQQHLEKEKELRLLDDAERRRLLTAKAILIQRAARGKLGRLKADAAREQLNFQIQKMNAIVLIQKCSRGALGRARARAIKQNAIMQLVMGKSIATVQRVWRGHRGRRLALTRRQLKVALVAQRIVRGHFGRKIAKLERQRLERIRLENASALKIQCAWRIKVALEEYRVLYVHRLASTELQRVLRGHLARKRVTKLRLWARTEPGPARIELGLQLIKESKDEFERHQDELDGLHRAQEMAETRVNHIYNTLKESEKELEDLRCELDGLDHMEDDFIEETDFSRPVSSDTRNKEEVDEAAASSGQALDVTQTQGMGAPPKLERMLQTKKVERDKRKRYLESELNLVLSEVKEKRVALERLELAIADMEETRHRKDREFRRMQRDLMGLLNEQKDELDQLREKGIELETVTATTAAAAAATAVKARDHEKQTAKMFNQQEELMKFQFMSMSLSYFSSLGMLKEMRNMASDATAAAVSSSADTAAAAAAAAAAANIPSTGGKSIGFVGGKADAFGKIASNKGAEIKQARQRAGLTEDEKQEPLPSDCRLWTIGDVSKWLRGLSLGAYVDKFEEACVDGDFLLDLKEEDFAGVLGMEHKLHRKKLVLARDKLRPLSEEEKRMQQIVAMEEQADQKRKELRIPDSDTVFSQARHGRLRRLEESLDDGFSIDAKDDQGNTLLMTAVQNGHKKMVDLLVHRGSSVNNANNSGNTALHYALAYDKSGEMATYLIQRGADDTIENNQGLSAYDGLGDEEQEGAAVGS